MEYHLFSWWQKFFITVVPIFLWKKPCANLFIYKKFLRDFFFNIHRSRSKDDRLQEPLKIDTTHDILEVDQPSASSGIGPSPKNDSESPKVMKYYLYQTMIYTQIWKLCLFLLLYKIISSHKTYNNNECLSPKPNDLKFFCPLWPFNPSMKRWNAPGIPNQSFMISKETKNSSFPTFSFP